MNPCRIAITVLSAVVLSTLSPFAARAQTNAERTTAATALYEDALKDLDAKRYDTACQKLEAVVKLAPEGLGGKLTLGGCYEAQGKLASAWSQYTMVETMGTEVGQADRAKRAAQKAAELKPRLAIITVQVPKETASIAGLSVLRDGTAIAEAQWGTPLPVDTGSHEIAVTAPGRKTWTKQVEVKANGEAITVTVEPPEAPVAAPAPAPTPPPPPAPAPSDRRWQRPVAIAAMALGGAGVAAGAILGGLAISQNDESNNGHCNAKDECDQTGFDLRRSALALGNGSTGALIAGGTVLAGGIVLFLTAPSAKSPKEQAGRKPAVSAHIELLPHGVRLKGVW